MPDYDVEIVEAVEECCGTDVCPHTSIEHEGHVGWLVDGKLRCRTDDNEPLFECSLNWDDHLKCELVALLDGHVHGPGCGHERVPHGDHYDYIVGTRLHHVVDADAQCCDKKCLGDVVKSTVVDHGHVDVRRRVNGQLAGNSGGSNEKTARTDIFAAGICCPSEVPVIHKILNGLSGVASNNECTGQLRGHFVFLLFRVVSVDVAVMTKNVHVEHDPSVVSPAVLVSALNGAGLQASIGKRGRQSGESLLIFEA